MIKRWLNSYLVVIMDKLNFNDELFDYDNEDNEEQQYYFLLILLLQQFYDD